MCYFCAEFWCCLVAVWYSVFILFFLAYVLYVLEISQTILHRYEWIVGEGSVSQLIGPDRGRSPTLSFSLQAMRPPEYATLGLQPGSSRVLCHTLTATAGIHAVAGVDDGSWRRQRHPAIKLSEFDIDVN